MGSHDDHSHAVAADADNKWLSVALVLIVTLMIGETIAGAAAHSLALLSDAAHMLTDAAALAFALAALRLAKRPATGSYTYGLKRAEILSAQANGLTLLLLALWLAYGAVRHLIDPPEVHGSLVLATAGAGIVVNLIATWVLSKANRSSLNIEGAFQHIVTDLFAFIATAIAGLVLIITGFDRADAIATLFIVALMLGASVSLLRESGRIFMEAAPTNVNAHSLGDELVSRPGVVEIHDLHLWQITSDQAALSAHVLARTDADCHAVRRDLENVLHNTYNITHTTLQVDHHNSSEPGCGDDHGPDSHGIVHRSS